MSNLSDFYVVNKTPDSDKIQLEKNILFVVPEKGHDISGVLAEFGLSRFEVAVTWPKSSIAIFDEIVAVGAKVVLQVDCQLSRKYPVVNSQKLETLEPFKAIVCKDIADQFVGLHHHDEFSIKDGLGTVANLVKLLKAQRRSFCCITNHGSVGGWIKQYNACKKAGVKAIFAMEAYTSNYRGDDPEKKKAHRSANHLVLLANTEEGFFNIIRIHNDAQLNGFYYTPRVNREALEKWGNGIIASSACTAGELSRLLMDGKEAEAKEMREFHSRVFDAFYVEIQIIEMEEQREANRRLIQFARNVGTPIVVTLDCLESSTNVIMSDGSCKKIKDVVVGDMVSTDDGKDSVVEAVGKRKVKVGERVFRVRSGTQKHDIICTEDHPFLIEFATGRREWVKAANLRTDDHLVVPHPIRDEKKVVIRMEDYFVKKQSVRKVGNGWISTRTDKQYTVPEFIEVDEEFCWVLGLYIAEGYRDNYVTGFGLHREEDFYASKAYSFFKKYGFNPTIEKKSKNNSQTVRVSSFGFAPLFEKLCGKGCSKKHLPYFWKNLNEKCLASLLDGYFCGDGCYNKECLSCVSVSEILIYQIQQAMLSLGFYSNLIFSKKKPDSRNGRIYRDSYHLQYGNEQLCRMAQFFTKIGKIEKRKKCNRGVVDKGLYHLVRVTDIEEISDRDNYEFWDISIKDRHCFVAESRIVHNSHYLDPEYSLTHDVLMCLRQKKTLVDKREKDDVWSFDVKNLFYRDAASVRDVFENGWTDDKGEYHAAFKDDVFTEEVFAEAMANTLKIARGTKEIVLDSKIKLPKLYDNGKEVLRKKVNAGFTARGYMKKSNRDEYISRLKYEFDIITKTGWCDYFLTMERIVTDAREEFGEWAWGYGRGSSASSLVVNCLGITDIDPIEYGLIFERFLDYSRPDPPDIDVDADPRIRDWIKRHIVEVFGENKVCSIGTYATYKTRAVILDVARALGENLAEVSAVTKRIEPLRAFEDEAGEEFKVDQMDFDDLCEHYPELKAYFDQHPEVRTHSEILRNQVKNMGTHAGGVIVSDLDLKDRIPVCRDKSGQIVSTWGESGNVQELSAVGLVKLDLLGLKTLSVISDCVKMIEITTGKHIARADIPTSDRESILMGSKKDLVGIFQFENPVTKPIADAVGMESLMDVAVVTSLIRPGPMDAMIDGVRMPMEYARRKHGGEYKSPEFIKTALFNTHSLLVFQEDTMNLARVLAGYSPLEANRLRKSVGKKIRELMISMRDSFINGAKSRIDSGEITLVEVEDMWNQIEKFSGYGFAKPHAVAYGAITTVELWLKHNFPIQFCTALINNTKLGKKKHGSDNVLVDYINYARRREIPVLVPDINMSRDEFSIEGDSIRFALGHVKGVATAAKLIESFQPFTGIQDFYDRVKVVDEDDDTVAEVADCEAGVKEDIETEPTVKTPKKVAVRRPNRRVVESLISAGAFDRFGTRNEMSMEYWRLRRKPTKKDRLALKVLEVEEVVKEAALALVTAQQSGVDKDIKKATKALTKAEDRVVKAKQAIIDDDKVDEVISDTQEDEGETEEVVKKASKDLPPEDKTDEEWQKAEAEVLGLCLSRPMLYKEYEDRIRKEDWYLISEIDPSQKKVMVFGEIMEVRQHISKAGNSMHIVQLSDGLDTMNFFVFQGGWEFFKDNFRTGYIGAVPLAKFDDDGNSDGSKKQTRFFDDRGKCIILKKG